ncbi:MAG: 6-carboxytetrahydropterin synthase [Firmicutes bacterium]|nr:6-carboxytetrahydropterin synthase [Bacillota bacterium]
MRELIFQAAVERPLAVVFQRADGAWEGHDYRVGVVAERVGLDGFDVVVDFRDLEAALDALLKPLGGRLLSESGLTGPEDLARWLLQKLAPVVPAPARLVRVSLEDGQGRVLALNA